MHKALIRPSQAADIDAILEIWLDASIQAHHFIAAEFWRAQREAMRQIYLPHAEVWVFRVQNTVVGFYALKANCLAAIFVAPAWQGKGVGRRLLAHAHTRQTPLTLTVYKENLASCQFYLKQGLVVIGEQIDPHTQQLEWVMQTKII